MPVKKKTTKKSSKTELSEKLTPTERAEKAEARVDRMEVRIEKLKAQIAVGNQVRGFVDFLREQSVVGLAIGLVLGTQAKVLVDQMIASFFSPFIGLLLPGEGALSQKTATLTIGSKSATFGWGAFVVSLLTFVIVAAVVYYVFKGLRLDKLDKKKED